MTTRTLAEAAAEVLNASRTRAGQMPMEKIASVRGTDGLAGQENEVDLGGATYDNPSGPETGKITAAHRGVAKMPKGPEQAPEKMHHLDDNMGGGEEQDHNSARDAYRVSMQKAGEDSTPEEHNDEHPAEHGEYAHPTMEEYELSEEEIEEAKEERKERAKAKMKEMSVKEDIEAMFSGENLSEDFKIKAATIFEAAVISRAVEVAEALEEEILDAAQEALDDARVDIEEQVDTYLNFVVENWVKENQVAIESGLRSEIVENFISGLKNLFAEHYVDVPAEKVDIVEAQAEQIAELEEHVNAVLNVNAELSKKLNEGVQASILSKACAGLTATQASKIKALAEGVEFTTEGEYTSKLNIIRESYAGKPVKQDNTSLISLNEEAPAHVEEETSSVMSAYVNAISRTQKI